jgi:hypothetical protein
MTDEKKDEPEAPGTEPPGEDIPVEDEPLEEVASPHTITAKPPANALVSASMDGRELATVREVAVVDRRLESEARRVDRAEQAVTSIEKAYEAFFAATGPDVAARRRKAIGRVLANVAIVEQEYPVPGSIGDFLADIGDSVAAAQERLDELTVEYLEWREHQGRELGLPTSFRLPRVHAEMSFELSEMSASRVGLIFPRRRSEQSRSRDHKISFDVVAVPPPPDMAEPPPVRLALASDAARKRVLAALEAAARNAVGSAKLRRAIERFDRAPIVRVLDQYFVLLAPNSARLERDFVIIKVSADQRVFVSDELEIPTRAIEPLLVALVRAAAPASASGDDGRKLLDAVKDAAVAARTAEFSQASVERLLDAAARVEQRFPGCAEDQPISDFFDDVASSLVEAQQRLDQRSLRYLDGRPLLPTTYRIPSLHAEMSFAVEATRGKRIKARLYREEQRQQAKREQRLSFDILAAPLDPGFVRDPEAGRGRTIYTVTRAAFERERVLELLRAHADAGPLIALLIAERAAILRGEHGHVVVARDRADPSTIHTAYVSREDNQLRLDELPLAATLVDSHAWLFEGWLA